MLGKAAWITCLYLGALSTSRAAVAQNRGEVRVAVGPRFLAAERGTGKAGAQRWTDASRQPAFLRRISIDLQRVPLGAALRDLGDRAGLRITYSPSVLQTDRSVTLSAGTITVGAALSALLSDAGIDVLLTPGGQVVLVKQGQAYVAAGNLVGRITDAKTQEKLGGVEVFLEDTHWRTTTDSNGMYSLREVDAGIYTLVARRLGYAKRARKVTVQLGQEDSVDIVLEPLAIPLNELVTTATGRQRRRDLGNDITTIKADSVLEHAPIRNLTDLLENRVPGLTVQHTTGAPGDPAKLRLRGLNSVLRGNDPVVVVDGVRVYAIQSEARSGNLTNTAAPTAQGLGGYVPAPSPLDQIDPNVIEKIEVFKGASAATLYGADAANGVIVITTKRGKPGPARWTANVTHGRETSPGPYPVGYYRWGHDIFNYTPRFCTLIDLTCAPDSLVRFQALNDPTFTVLGRGQRTAVSVTASGGTQALTYSVTGSYSDEVGLLTLPQYEVNRFRTQFDREAPDWMRRPHHYETWSVMSNVNARLSASADVTLTMSLARSEQRRTELEHDVALLSGTYVDQVTGLYYRPNGRLVGTENSLSLGLTNPTSALLDEYYTRTTASTITVTTGLNATWRPRSWFTATGQAGINIVPRSDHRLLPSYITFGDDSGAVANGTGHSVVGTTSIQGTLRKPLRWGFAFETNIGANVQTTSTEDVMGAAYGLIPGSSGFAGAKHMQIANATSSQSSYGWYIEPRLAGQRLSLSAGLRLDGGNANGGRITGTGARSGSLFSLRNLLTLPKLNGSWVISEEPWFPLQGLFSSLRLRGAYGQAQVQPGPTDRLRLYDNTVQLLTLGNTQIRPERSAEFEGGFDADLFDSRVSVVLTGYHKLQIDALMNVNLPGSVKGGTTVVKNIGNILNQGVDLGIDVTPLKSSGVIWTMGLNVSWNHNELTKLGTGVDQNTDLGIVEGYPIGGHWAKPILGFADQNGDGTVRLDEIRVGDSAVFVGRLLPAYKSALHTSVGLFGGALSVTSDFAYDHGGTQVDRTAITNWVLARPLFDPSAPLSDQAAVIAYVSSNNSLGLGTDYGVIQNVSTFRFDALSINYRAPKHVARWLGAERLGLAVQGQNLALRSTYRGKDPNVNAWSPGEGIVDTGQLPQPRTWQVRVDISY